MRSLRSCSGAFVNDLLAFQKHYNHARLRVLDGPCTAKSRLHSGSVPRSFVPTQSLLLLLLSPQVLHADLTILTFSVDSKQNQRGFSRIYFEMVMILFSRVCARLRIPRAEAYIVLRLHDTFSMWLLSRVIN